MTKTHLQRTGEEEEEGGEGKSEVPLGDAMLGTKLEVRDSQGKPVVKGYGEIYLGKLSSFLEVIKSENYRWRVQSVSPR